MILLLKYYSFDVKKHSHAQSINQSILFFVILQAIERVHINMIVNERCVDVLENAVSKLQNAGEKLTHHGLLFVNSKLLTLYSA
jgi:hypothetical protein